MYKDQNAAYALNSYIWKLLEANLDFSTDAYGGAKPIIPLAQQPELMQSGKAFLTYGAARHPSEHLYSLVKEAVSYTVFSSSATEVNKICNMMAEVFARQDIAAHDVNDWLAVEDKNRGVHFASIRTIMVEKAEPADEEGGYASGLVMLECFYTLNPQEIQTRFTAP